MNRQPLTRLDTAAVALLVGLCLVLFFFALGRMALWDIDEGMHATTSKEMVVTGDWLTPRFNGENFYDKPAFHNWLVAASFVVLGFTEMAARLPAAVLGLATVLLTFAIGRRLLGRGAGLLAGVILATSGEFILLSRMVLHDISLTFAVTAAIGAFAYGVTETDPRRRRRWWWPLWVACGVAVLAKGPLGVVLVGLVVAGYTIGTRRWTLLRELLHPAGVLVFLVVAAPWYVAMSLAHDDYAEFFFLEQNFGNFVGSGIPRHPRAWFYYGPVILGGFFPWSCFLPLAVIHAVRIGRHAQRDAIVLLLAWCGMILLFFSVATSKLATYVLPIFPALALLVAYAFHDLAVLPTRSLRRGFIVSWVALPLVCVVGLGVVVAVGVPTRLLRGSGLRPEHLQAVFGVLAAGAVVSLICFVARREHIAIGVVAATVVATALLLFGRIGPSLDDHLSTKTLAMELDRLVPPDEDVAMFERIIRVGDSVLFYTDRGGHALPDADALRDHFANRRRVYCLAERDHLGQLEPIRHRYDIVAEAGDKVILASRPAYRPRSTVRE